MRQLLLLFLLLPSLLFSRQKPSCTTTSGLENDYRSMQRGGRQAERIVTLQEAECTALKQNKQIRELEALYQKAREGRLEAWSKWWPTITAMTETFRSPRILPLTKSCASFASQVQLTQNILSTETYYNTKIATLEQEKLFLLLQAAINDLLFSVRTAYYQVILDKQLVATAREHIDLLAYLVKRMEQLYAIGESIPYRVNQSKVALANATTAYYQSIKALKSDRDQLTQILGLDPACILINTKEKSIPIQSIPLIVCKLHLINADLPTLLDREATLALESVALMPQLFEASEIVAWEQEANCHRPDIRLGENHMRTAYQQIERHKGEYCPTINFVGSYGSFPAPYLPYLSNSFFHQNFAFGAGIQLNWMLFDSFGRERRIDQAKSQWKAERYNFEQTVQLAHVDVRKQIYAIEESLSNYATSKASMELAQELVQQSADQLDAGYITIFDYQIAIDTLIQSQFIYEKAQFELATAYFGLRHATAIDLECRRP